MSTRRLTPAEQIFGAVVGLFSGAGPYRIISAQPSPGDVDWFVIVVEFDADPAQRVTITLGGNR